MKKILPTLFIGALLLISPNLTFAKDIQATGSYVREVPPGITTSAMFLTLHNKNNKQKALLKASSEFAKNVELHRHVHNDGMMQMRQVQKITIPAHDKITLKPSGYHIMLIGLTKKIKSGDIVTVILTFNDGSKSTIQAEVKKIMPSMN